MRKILKPAGDFLFNGLVWRPVEFDSGAGRQTTFREGDFSRVYI